MKTEQYKEVYSQDALYSEGERQGLKILVSLDRELTENDKNNIWKAGQDLSDSIRKETVLNNLKEVESGEKEVQELLKCFPLNEPIHARKIPNGYCNQPCCAARPWLVVTTKIGPITIGWRKRVISIDWSNSDVETWAEELFSNKDVTKYTKCIHAWSYDKAKEYLAKLIAS